MNITKHGVLSRDELNTETFKCKECGCEFTADYDEYYVEKGSCFTTSSSLVYTYTATATDTYVCSCPECHKIVTKTKQRTVENPAITLTGTATTKTSDDIPDACKNCPTHPSNGGSGVCNCIMGSMDKITC